MMILVSDAEQDIAAYEIYDSIQKCLSDINSSVVEKSRNKFEIKVTEKNCIITTSKAKLIVSCSNIKEGIIEHARIFRGESFYPQFAPKINNPILKIFLLFQRLNYRCGDILKLFSINSKTKIINVQFLQENLNPNEQKNDKSPILKEEIPKIMTDIEIIKNL